MRHKSLSLRYAKALFELGVRDQSLERFLEELRRLLQIFEVDRNVPVLLGAREVSLQKRSAILNGLMDKFFISPKVQNFMRLLMERGRISVFPHIVAAFEDLVLDSENKVRAYAKVASLAAFAPSRGAIEKKLSQMTGKKIVLNAEEDPSLIGGISVQIKDMVYDASVLGELNKIRETWRTL